MFQLQGTPSDPCEGSVEVAGLFNLQNFRYLCQSGNKKKTQYLYLHLPGIKA